MEQCRVCRDPGEWINRVATTEKKLENNCHAVEKLHARVEGFASTETHMSYIRQELREFKEDRKQFFKEMGSIREFMRVNYVTQARYKWVERVVFLIAGTGVLWAINFFRLSPLP